MFIRFVRPNLVKGMAARSGFFSAAYDLRRSPTTDHHTAAQVKDLLDWFHENLAEPTRFTRATPRNPQQAESFTKGISWFKPEATEILAKSRDLAALLQANGYPIQTLHTARPGYILYEDPHQIVAEPFADTPV